jgi:hypothetical protein
MSGKQLNFAHFLNPISFYETRSDTPVTAVKFILTKQDVFYYYRLL